MKLLSFQYEGKTLFGPKVKKEEAVWDVLSIAAHYDKSDFPTTIIEGVASGLDFVESIRQTRMPLLSVLNMPSVQ